MLTAEEARQLHLTHIEAEQFLNTVLEPLITIEAYTNNAVKINGFKSENNHSIDFDLFNFSHQSDQFRLTEEIFSQLYSLGYVSTYLEHKSENAKGLQTIVYEINWKWVDETPGEEY